MAAKICVFDAYGTLFDVAAAAREAASEPDMLAIANSWEKVANEWRLKQLQYSWIRAIVGEHADFWTVTSDGLDWALKNNGLDGNANLRERLLALYRELAAYPEVSATLSRLRASGKSTAILSNGSPSMLDSAVKAAGIESLLDAVLSVESVGVFKPNRYVYDLVGRRFGGKPSEVLFASSNGWDASSAAHFGFYSIWVNRSGEPVDNLPWKPNKIVDDLSEIPSIANRA
ncbi:MAG: haloacid dehalogenase type II [Albidovulum sp.]|nr:haloacid dehalogenase type II [Albidovulum sp.]